MVYLDISDETDGYAIKIKYGIGSGGGSTPRWLRRRMHDGDSLDALSWTCARTRTRCSSCRCFNHWQSKSVETTFIGQTRTNRDLNAVFFLCVCGWGGEPNRAPSLFFRRARTGGMNGGVVMLQFCRRKRGAVAAKAHVASPKSTHRIRFGLTADQFNFPRATAAAAAAARPPPSLSPLREKGRAVHLHLLRFPPAIRSCRARTSRGGVHGTPVTENAEEKQPDGLDEALALRAGQALQEHAVAAPATADAAASSSSSA